MLDLFKSRIFGISGKLLVFPLILLLVFSSFVFAQPPFTASEFGNAQLVITPALTSFVEVGSDLTISWHVYNSSGFILNASFVSCNFHFYSQSGVELIDSSSLFNANEYYFVVSGDNISSRGTYPYLIYCNNTQAGFYSSEVIVTIDGWDLDFDSTFKFFLIFLLGVGLFIVGRVFQDYTFGISGGLVLWLLGFYVLLTPIIGWAAWINTLFGSISWGLGFYVVVVGSLELLKDKGFMG